MAHLILQTLGLAALFLAAAAITSWLVIAGVSALLHDVELMDDEA